jgi:hypothetical protein
MCAFRNVSFVAYCFRHHMDDVTLLHNSHWVPTSDIRSVGQSISQSRQGISGPPWSVVHASARQTPHQPHGSGRRLRGVRRLTR